MLKTFLHHRIFHSKQPSHIGMKQNLAMGWNYSILEQLYEKPTYMYHGVFIISFPHLNKLTSLDPYLFSLSILLFINKDLKVLMCSIL
jgi:hypothetical protein